jgi:hypothetical protein
MAAKQTKVLTPVAESATSSKITAADVQAMVLAQVEAAIDKKRAEMGLEEAEPQNWWDILAIGPIQPGAGFVPTGSPGGPGPFLPNGIIRAGEKAYIVTVLILNPLPLPQDPSIIPSEFLSTFALPYEVTYQTGNLTEWKKGPAYLNVEHYGTLIPGQAVYVDVLEFTADDKDEVMYEMNVSARIFGCGNNYAPYFAAFARETVDLDADLFSEAPGLGNRPIRFMVYGDKPADE